MHEARVSENSLAERVPLKDAAALLGITAGAVRARLRRGTLQSEKDGEGQLWILIERTPRPVRPPEVTDPPPVAAAAAPSHEDKAQDATYSAAPAPPGFIEPPVAAPAASSAPPAPETVNAAPPSADVNGRLFDMQEVYQHAFTMIQSEHEAANALYAQLLHMKGENARVTAERDALKARVRELERTIFELKAEQGSRSLLLLEELIEQVSHLTARQPRRWWKR